MSGAGGGKTTFWGYKGNMENKNRYRISRFRAMRMKYIVKRL